MGVVSTHFGKVCTRQFSYYQLSGFYPRPSAQSTIRACPYISCQLRISGQFASEWSKSWFYCSFLQNSLRAHLHLELTIIYGSMPSYKTKEKEKLTSFVDLMNNAVRNYPKSRHPLGFLPLLWKKVYSQVMHGQLQQAHQHLHQKSISMQPWQEYHPFHIYLYRRPSPLS